MGESPGFVKALWFANSHLYEVGFSVAQFNRLLIAKTEYDVGDHPKTLYFILSFTLKGEKIKPGAYNSHSMTPLICQLPSLDTCRPASFNTTRLDMQNKIFSRIIP